MVMMVIMVVVMVVVKMVVMMVVMMVVKMVVMIGDLPLTQQFHDEQHSDECRP